MCIDFWKGGRIHFNLLTPFLSETFLPTFFHYQIKLFIGEENNLQDDKLFSFQGFRVLSRHYSSSIYTKKGRQALEIKRKKEHYEEAVLPVVSI